MASSSSRPALKAETIEDEELVKKLFRLVLRSFYDDRLVVIGEQVMRWELLPADVLAARLGVQAKELAPIVQKLVDDKMLRHFRRSEKREGIEGRSSPSNYYYVHPPLFLAMLKYRLHRLRQRLDSSISSGSYTTSYVCPQCGYRYSTLDVAHLLDFLTNALRCERPGCAAELQEDEEEGEETRRGKERMRRFNEQCSAMLKGLEALEGVQLSYIDPEAFLADEANHKWKSLKEQSKPGHDPNDFADLPNAKITHLSNMPMPTISLTDADTSAAALRAAQEEADRQRKENAIPEWLGKSTVSGQETSLGIKERKAREAQADRARGGTGAATEQQEDADEEDYYAQYAQMQAAAATTTNGSRAKEESVDSSPLTNGGGVKREREESSASDGKLADGNKKIKTEEQNGKAVVEDSNASVTVGELEDEDEEEFEEVA